LNSILNKINKIKQIKTIPGGNIEDCCYVDGIVFRKQVLHKRMQKAIPSPKILLLAGGIEFQRSATQRMAAFDTLMEQERTYVTILVEKIVSLKPDLVLVGQSVSRAAQEYLEQHDVVVVQHVKAKLMRRIARSIGAVILSSTDHVMNRTASEYTPLGRCSLFSVVAFPSLRLEAKLKRREARKREGLSHNLHDGNASDSSSSSSSSSSEGEGNDDDGAPHLRRTRGHGYVNHIYLEGCPKDLGCSLVLRGADKPTLKEVKRIMRGAINAAYNLRLEIAYLHNRFARLPDSIFDTLTLGASSRLTLALNSGGSLGAEVAEAAARKRRLLSTSLAVDFGPLRTPEVRFDSVTLMRRKPVNPLQTTAFEHQSILVTSVWMSNRVQCAPAEVLI
jgi:1-phosphatidylinositol-3-phosphate 5-kinase